MQADVVAFIPLSNWLRGFERYGMRYSKALISQSRFPDAFYVLREGEPFAPGLEKSRRLVAKLGLPHDRVVALRAQLPVGPSGLRPNDVTGTGIGWHWPSSSLPLSGVAWVNEQGALEPTRHEEVTAQAFLIHDSSMRAWAECRPRSFSVLPVARACQASCAFCFSRASVSDLERQQSATLEHQLAWADQAKQRGAERAVITGGGEPTLLAPRALLDLVRGLASRFPKTLLITNGARLDAQKLASLRQAGLTTLGISRHGTSVVHDAKVMGLAVDSARAAKQARALGLRTRAICVLQRGGVDTAQGVRTYLERSVADGFDEVCFKELYVSSVLESQWASSAVNQFCERHQVPLALVPETLATLGFVQTAALPWGSPIFEGQINGQPLRVAAYTEPSVGWERSNGVVRSWNVMADGACLASLEDAASALRAP